MTDTVFIAKAMPNYDSRVVYVTKVGVTEEAAKSAVCEVMENHEPAVMASLEWDDDSVRHRGWWFVVKERKVFE